jgi:predicted DNA-binding transcriptional regulator YafY
MKEIICDAINRRLVIQFNYDGELRIVEPFVLGYHKDTGNLVLRSYRVGGFSKSEREPNWRLFDTSMIQNLQITEKIAHSDREYYNPNDKHMSKIICNI